MMKKLAVALILMGRSGNKTILLLRLMEQEDKTKSHVLVLLLGGGGIHACAFENVHTARC